MPCRLKRTVARSARASAWWAADSRRRTSSTWTPRRHAPCSLSFFVPAVEPNRNYNVAISGGGSTLSAGPFHADPTGATVTPTSLTLRIGERQTVTFTIPTPAPQGGLLLDVTTDVPESVIMPEVVVAEGATSVVVTVQGGKPGAGALYLKGFGPGEITIPVSVSGR